MKIAFVIYQGAVISGKSNGIRSQAMCWKKYLEKSGLEVILIDNWGDYEWTSFDVIHFFGYDLNLLNLVKNIYKHNKNLFFSPIIDSTRPYKAYKLASYLGLSRLRLFSVNYVLRESLKYFKGIFVRSNHESGYFTNSFKICDSNVHLVRLSYSLPNPTNIDYIISHKKDFCLHISSLYQDRKNVQRLIEAAKKYNFNLKLAGNVGSKNQHQMISDWIGDSTNIELLGYVSYDKLIELYKDAKVFALPSTCEGVGIVALDAALYGNNIVITDIPGPKEYYAKLSTVSFCNPHNIDSIGKAVLQQLSRQSNLDLYLHIRNHYHADVVTKQLISTYNM